jgi:hypothetical protein
VARAGPPETVFCAGGSDPLARGGLFTTKRQAVERSSNVCGFLGADVCGELKPGAREEAGLRYLNPQGMPTQYDKVTILVVGFFGSDTAKAQPKDEQRLTDLFYRNLHEVLAKRYPVVDEPGPGVVKVEVALLDAEAATPGVRSVTMVVPQLRVLSAGYALAAGKYPFAGGGQAASRSRTPSLVRSLRPPWIARPGVDLSRPLPSGSRETPKAQSRAGPRRSPTGCTSYTSGAKKP